MPTTNTAQRGMDRTLSPNLQLKRKYIALRLNSDTGVCKVRGAWGSVPRPTVSQPRPAQDWRGFFVDFIPAASFLQTRGQRISPPALVPTGFFNRKAQSELGWQIAIDFESDADFHEYRSCPVHSHLPISSQRRSIMRPSSRSTLVVTVRQYAHTAEASTACPARPKTARLFRRLHSRHQLLVKAAITPPASLHSRGSACGFRDVRKARPRPVRRCET
jgi:hypothetical protein